LNKRARRPPIPASPLGSKFLVDVEEETVKLKSGSLAPAVASEAVLETSGLKTRSGVDSPSMATAERDEYTPEDEDNYSLMANTSTRFERTVPEIGHHLPPNIPQAALVLEVDSFAESTNILATPAVTITSKPASADLARYFEGWDAKGSRRKMEMDCKEAGRNFASPSGAATSSVADHPHSSVDIARLTRCKRHPVLHDPRTPLVAPNSAGGGMVVQTSTPSQLAAMPLVSPSSESASMSLDSSDSTSGNHTITNVSGYPGRANQSDSIGRKPRDNKRALIDESITEPEIVATKDIWKTDPVNSNRANVHQTPDMLRPQNVSIHSTNTALVVKKPCVRCGKLILGTFDSCIKCRQMADHKAHPKASISQSNDNMRDTASSPAKVMDMTNKDYHHGELDDCHNTDKELSRKINDESIAPAMGKPPAAVETGVNKISTSDVEFYKNGAPDSPVIPETPEVHVPFTSTSLQSQNNTTNITSIPPLPPPQQLIPQKRGPLGSAVTNNEHIFARKKQKTQGALRMPTHVTSSTPNLNKFRPIAGRNLDPVKRNSKDASVQTNPETVERGTSPSRPVDEPAQQSPAPRGRLTSLASCPNGIRGMDGANCENVLPKPFSARKSKRPPAWHQKNGISGREAREPPGRPLAYGRPQAAIAAIQFSVHGSDQVAAQEATALEAETTTVKERSHSGGYLNPDSIEENPGEGPAWTSDDEKALVQKLQKKGVIFEDDCSDSDVEVPPPQSKCVPKDPLWRRPQSSTDLFLVAPYLKPNYASVDIELKRKEIAARPSKKQRRLKIPYLRHERGSNIHEEVIRSLPPRTVKVRSLESSNGAGFGDETVTGALGPLKETDVTFSDFVGVPENPMIILTKDKQLAFRDGRKDGKGVLPRAREKFIVTNRSVSCMER
jgi:hypothetical protein